MLANLKSHSKLILIFFFVTFNYYILISLKDAILITSGSSGAAVIPFAKTYLILPSSILFGFLFIRLNNHYSLNVICKVFISLFLFSFLLFATVLYPNYDALLPLQFTEQLQIFLPSGWQGFITLIRHWPSALFYLSAELWGTFIYSVLLWGITNEHFSFNESKSIYPSLLLAGNIAALCAGQTSIALTVKDWSTTLNSLTFIIIICGIVILFLLPQEGKEKAKPKS